MAKSRPKSKQLVIDASVMRAAGDLETSSPQGKACRDFLMAARRVCHRTIVSKELKDEWDKHGSRFAMTWRQSMV